MSIREPQKALALFIAAFILCGCVKDTTLDAGLERKVVIEFVLTEDNVQNLYLSLTGEPGEKVAPPVQEAEIRLIDVTKSKELNRDIVFNEFVRVSDNQWTLDYAGIPGHEYRLEVTVDGFDLVWAEQKMPEKVELNRAAVGHGALPKYTDTFAGWENNVDIGAGNSFGGEFLYEYLGRELYFRTTYTLSKTDREGFATICDGGKFHARFDRRHILNMQGRWKGFSMAMTLQSGHWENGAPLTYQIHIPGLKTDAEYYEGVNNFQMPAVFRLDLGYELAFRTGRIEHTVNLGVCNVTNHFNPFMLYFDTRTESWKEIALLPILPNFSWRVGF